jgi:hypothetical protein
VGDTLPERIRFAKFANALLYVFLHAAVNGLPYSPPNAFMFLYL